MSARQPPLTAAQAARADAVNIRVREVVAVLLLSTRAAPKAAEDRHP